MAISSVSVKYGDYQFKPAPLLDISTEIFKTDADTRIGGAYNVTIKGKLLPYTTGASDGPIDLFRAERALRGAFNYDGGLFVAEFSGAADCSGQVLNGYPMIKDISIDSQDQWHTTADYTINLSFPYTMTTGGGGTHFDSVARNLTYLLKNASVTYDWESAQESYSQGGSRSSPVFRIRRNISAQGQTIYNMPDGGAGAGTITGGLDAAKQYCLTYGSDSGVDLSDFNLTGVLLPTGEATGAGSQSSGIQCLQSRTISVDPTAHKYGIVDEFILHYIGGPFGSVFTSGNGAPDTGMNAAAQNVFDNYEIEVSTELESALTTVTVNGTVQGIKCMGLSSGVPLSSYDPFGASSGYVQALLTSDQAYQRAVSFYSGSLTNMTPGAKANFAGYGSGSLDLQKEPTSTSFGYNILEATASYSFTFNNRPANCFSGALSETISLTRAKPVEVHSNLTILGRKAGPILQAIGTRTAWTQEINIEAAAIPYRLCNTGDLWDGNPGEHYDGFVTRFEASISGDDFTIFRTQDQETWDPKNGRYTRGVNWIYTECAD